MSQTITHKIRYPEKMTFAPQGKGGMHVLTISKGNKPPNFAELSAQFQKFYRKLTTKQKEAEFEFRPERGQPPVIYQVECIHDGARGIHCQLALKDKTQVRRPYKGRTVEDQQPAVDPAKSPKPVSLTAEELVAGLSEDDERRQQIQRALKQLNDDFRQEPKLTAAMILMGVMDLKSRIAAEQGNRLSELQAQLTYEAVVQVLQEQEQIQVDPGPNETGEAHHSDGSLVNIFKRLLHLG
ncbi:hypothetical protein [Gimesia chilikensis]|uniref:Uncharacterized protein n=1 Tax=Gimesia chilikensis TaxID=2605989 RepID=A0A517PSW7_9PLAN|nr:hypothetical protein [Gimesia chilikensis]QDT22472.1 hypothetical protein HG66A1_42800 [Gimesia chilikensis]